MKKVNLILLSVFLLSGCGPIWYGMEIIHAKKAISSAKENGAGRGKSDFAKYEITYAEEHLKKAQEEVGKADYQAAIDLAKLAVEYGQKANDIAVGLKMEAGRTTTATPEEE